MIFTMTFNIVNVQAESLDYLGNTIDGSVLTNDDDALEYIKVLPEVHICWKDL